ncbi:O-antigen ligase family protein [Pseudomonas canadensis]|uniref:O-antigen ligase family protein n=1 Tax=Pseudomonas canadensis TaxID=915099 RepID=UPI0030CDCD5A
MMTQPTSYLERFLVASTLFVLVWLPLPLGSNRDWSAGLLILLVSFLGVVWVVNQVRGGIKLDSRNKTLRVALPMFGLLLLTQVWVALQWLTGISMDNGATLQYLTLGLAYSLLFLLIISTFHTRQRLILLLSVLIISGTFQAFYGAYMSLSGSKSILASIGFGHSRVTSGTFVNRNHLAGYLEMTLACGIGLLLALRDGKPFRWISVLELLMGAKARLRLALVVMVIALVMTNSRMGNTAFFVSLIGVGALFILRNREHRVRNSMILISLILIDMLVISQYFGLERLKERVVNTHFQNVVVEGEVVQQANVIRLDINAYILPLAMEKPLVGEGAGSFEAVFPEYAGEDVRSHFDHAHNDYMQFIIEYGLIGSLPLLAFALLALWRALQALWRRESLFCSGIGFGAAMGIISIGIHSAVDFNLQIPANAATFTVLCAIAVLANNHSNPRHKPILKG